MPRLFVGIEIPEAICQDLIALQPAAASDVAPTPPALMHATLHFVGEVTEAIFTNLKERLGEITLSAFELPITGVGCFPPDDRPGFLWASVEKSSSLVALRNAVGQILEEQGIELESREYCPHVTLARLDTKNPELIDAFLKTHREFRTLFVVDCFSIYASERTDDGPVYTKVAEFLLKKEIDQ